MQIRMTAWGCASLCALGILGASAADIVFTPPPSGGVSVMNAASNAVRFRVGEDGVVTLPGVGSAAASATPLCVESATGKVGTCVGSVTSSTPVAKWLLKIGGITAAAGEEVAAVNWSASHAATGNPAVNDLNLVQAARTPSLVRLMQNVFRGTHLASVIVEYYEPPDTVVLRYTLTDVLVSSVQTGGSTLSAQSHNFSFTPGTITILDVTTGVQTCWNVATNASC